MKTRVLLLAVILTTVCSQLYSQSASSGCNGVKRYVTPLGDNGRIISGNPSSMWYFQVNPGDTIVISNQYAWNFVRIEEYSGTPSCPITVINEGGQVWLTGGIQTESCKYFKITGSGHPNVFYGFRMYNPQSDVAGVAVSIEGKAKSIEVERIDVYRKTYGVWAKQDPKCDISFNYPNYVMDSINIHHSRFKNIGQDCIYAGNTDPAGERTYYCNGQTMQFIPMRMGNVSIHHLVIDSCNRTAIQLSGSDHGVNRIYDNIITNTGYEFNQHQGTGISIGGMTTNCYVYNNKIKNTFLYGIFDLGAGTSYITNNEVDSSGYIPINPFVAIDSLAAALGLGYNGHVLKNTLLGGIKNIQATTKPTVPLTSKTIFYKNNKLGANSSTIAPNGVISFSEWGPAVDWTNNNKVCSNKRLDGTTPAHIEKFWFAGQNQFWPLMDTTCGSTINTPPVAMAGQDFTSVNDSFLLAGSGTDVDGTIVGYQWSVVSGPATCNVVNSLLAQTSVTGVQPGIYTFRLTVTDNSGDTGTDDVQVSFNAPNLPPSANAGLPVTIHLPKDSALVMGSGNDADGTIANYLWTKIAGPASYIIQDPANPQTMLKSLSAGVYKFELKVTDNLGAFERDTVTIYVNQPPVVNAGADVSIILPVNQVQLNGTAIDNDGWLYNTNWNKISGPSAFSISSPNQGATLVTGLIEGVYQFEISAQDNQGAFSRDTVKITVIQGPNVAPVANAGTNQVIQLPVNSVTLNGSGTDVDGVIVSYQWSKTSGPNSYTITNSNAAQTTVTGLVQGQYTFKLKVKDDDGATDNASVQITVNAAIVIPNVLPVANAGTNQTITLPVNSVNLSGSGTDTDGTIVSYQWKKVSGPSGFIFSNATAAQTTVGSLTQGTYVFQLKVTDDDGGADSASVQVIVNAAVVIPNVLPVANAGTNQTITLPVNSVNLSGSGTDTDGTIVSYQWKKVSGPSGFIFSNATAAQTTVGSLTEGTYVFQLKVTDDDGGADSASVQVIVNAAVVIPNVLPVANAGTNQTITLPVNSVNLSGSGTDTDGTIVSYQWKKVSGPSGFIFSNATAAQTTVGSLTQGTYVFQLKVTDDDGGTDSASVQVMVNAAVVIPNMLPVANAGTNQTITLPVNSVNLSGSGTDTDGTIVSYQWKKVSGPSGFIFSNATAAQTTVGSLTEGTYVFQLKVTDDDGGADSASVQVTVNAQVLVANQLPLANAGPDQYITLPVNSVTIYGSGTDHDGVIASYKWRKISGAQAIFSSISQPQITVSSLAQGSYKFELTVKDNKGATGRDTVTVFVNPETIAFGNAAVFPNPAKTSINLQIDAPTQKNLTDIKIYDQAGRLVYEEKFVRDKPQVIRRINISTLKPGMYFIEYGNMLQKNRTIKFFKD